MRRTSELSLAVIQLIEYGITAIKTWKKKTLWNTIEPYGKFDC